jgi:hypothetical protein
MPSLAIVAKHAELPYFQIARSFPTTPLDRAPPYNFYRPRVAYFRCAACNYFGLFEAKRFCERNGRRTVFEHALLPGAHEKRSA